MRSAAVEANEALKKKFLLPDGERWWHPRSSSACQSIKENIKKTSNKHQILSVASLHLGAEQLNIHRSALLVHRRLPKLSNQDAMMEALFILESQMVFFAVQCAGLGGGEI